MLSPAQLYGTAYASATESIGIRNAIHTLTAGCDLARKWHSFHHPHRKSKRSHHDAATTAAGGTAALGNASSIGNFGTSLICSNCLPGRQSKLLGAAVFQNSHRLKAVRLRTSTIKLSDLTRICPHFHFRSSLNDQCHNTRFDSLITCQTLCALAVTRTIQSLF